MNHLIRVAAVVLVVGLGPFATAESNRATLADLDFMNGAWKGVAGNGHLEETWSAAHAGTKMAMVRQSSPDGTQMVEIIVIEEVDGELIFRLQQFSSALEPRFTPAAVMKLVELGDNTASFEKVGAGGIAALTYTRLDTDTFTIDVTLTEGTELGFDLKAQ